MENLTPSNIAAFVLVLVGIAAVLTAVDKGIEAWNNLSGRKKRAAENEALIARIVALENTIKEHSKRLDDGDERFELLTKDSEQTLNILNAILMHEISGNDHQKLKETKANLDAYLTKRH